MSCWQGVVRDISISKEISQKGCKCGGNFVIMPCRHISREKSTQIFKFRVIRSHYFFYMFPEQP